MGSTKKTQRTFDLKLNLHCNCEGCAKKVRDIVLEIEGVVSIDIDKDLKLGKATVSGNVSPETVIEKLKDKGKPAELLRKEEKKERPQKMKDPKIQNVPHNPAQRKGNPQPPGNGNPQRVKNKDKGKHRKGEEEERPAKKKHEEVLNEQRNPDQRKVTPQPSDLEKAIHDGNPKHDHEYELKSYNKPFKCDKCREDGFTSGYRCKLCIFDLHEFCLNPKPKINHDFFPKSTFKLVKKPGKFCDACGKEIHGHSYRCKEDNLDLHPACSKLPGKLCISGMDFELYKNVKYRCFWCKEKNPCWFAKTKVEGLCYVSKLDKYSCHLGCLFLMMEEAWKRAGQKSDRNNDFISKELEKMDVKPVANAKGSGGLFLKAVTIFVKMIVGILFGDPTGLIVSGVTELVKVFLTL